MSKFLESIQPNFDYFSETVGWENFTSAIVENFVTPKVENMGIFSSKIEAGFMFNNGSFALRNDRIDREMLYDTKTDFFRDVSADDHINLADKNMLVDACVDLKSLSTAGQFDLQTYKTAQGTSLHAIISFSGEILSGCMPVYAVDNCNIGCAPQNVFTFTSATIADTEAVNPITALSSMTGKVNLICPELYTTNNSQTINVTIKDIFTDATTQNFTIQINPNPDTQSHFSHFFTGCSSTGEMISSMYISATTTVDNSRGKFGDLNLLALIFIFWTAGFNVELCPKEENGIKKSFKTRWKK